MLAVPAGQPAQAAEPVTRLPRRRPSLEVIINAAAPCPVPVKEQMIAWLGPIMVEYYGATELNGLTFCDSKDWLAHKGTVGRAVLGEVLILDDAENNCPADTPGTVRFRGATNFEYFNDLAKTAESRNIAGDVSTVGDVGYLDGAGISASPTGSPT